MKAVVLHSHGDSDCLRVENVKEPRPAAGKVLIRLAWTVLITLISISATVRTSTPIPIRCDCRRFSVWKAPGPLLSSVKELLISPLVIPWLIVWRPAAMLSMSWFQPGKSYLFPTEFLFPLPPLSKSPFLYALDLLFSYHFTLLQWILAFIAAICLGLSKTGFLGVSLLGIALMAEVWPPRESTGIILPMLIFGDIFAVTFFTRHSIRSEVIRVLPPAIGGVIIGYFCFRALPATIFGPLIGWIVLVLLILQIWYRASTKPSATDPPDDADAAARRAFLSLPVPIRRTITYLLGALTGLTTMLANASGPVMTVYLLAAGLAKYEFVGTSAWIFCLLNLSKLPLSYSLGVINLHSLGFNLLMLPAIALGAIAGKSLLKVVPQLWFERLLVLSAFIAAIKLIWR